MKVQKTKYGLWDVEGDISYWSLYDSIKDAAIESDGRTIYQLDAKPLGKYEVKAVLQKVKQRKVKRKKSK